MGDKSLDKTSSSMLQPKKMGGRNSSSNNRTSKACATNSKKQKAMAILSRRTANVDNDDGLMLTFLSLPMPLRIHILNYLGQTQEELMDLRLISRQIYEDCKRPGIEWKVIPTIEISPTKGGYIWKK
jgi:hypothetical protein